MGRGKPALYGCGAIPLCPYDDAALISAPAAPINAVTVSEPGSDAITLPTKLSVDSMGPGLVPEPQPGDGGSSDYLKM
jgi:hypothetical protein